MKKRIPFLIRLILINLLCSVSSCKDNTSEKLYPSFTEYYPNGRIKSNTEMDNNGRASGLYIMYYPNGLINKTCIYKDGKIDGDMLIFYEDGRLKQKVGYNNDKPNGLSLTFYQSGFIETFRTISNGKDTLYGVNYKDTIELSPAEVVYFSENGDLVYKEYLDENGKVLKTDGKR